MYLYCAQDMSAVVSRDILKTFSNHRHMSIKSLSLNAKMIKKHVTWILLFQHNHSLWHSVLNVWKSRSTLPVVLTVSQPFPASNYMIKVDNRNTRRRCKICSKLYSWSSPEQWHWCRYSVFVTFEQISHFVLVFLLLILSR